MHKSEQPYIINFFGGPGAGKSSIAAGLFAHLKSLHVNCELVTEIAKDLTWEERKLALGCQPYVFGLQLFNLEKLRNKVDIIITDSPILLSTVYCQSAYKEKMDELVWDIFWSFKNINFLLTRPVNFTSIGRNQNLEEAKELDDKINTLLSFENYHTISVGNDSIKLIVDILKTKYNLITPEDQS